MEEEKKGGMLKSKFMRCKCMRCMNEYTQLHMYMFAQRHASFQGPYHSTPIWLENATIYKGKPCI